MLENINVVSSCLVKGAQIQLKTEEELVEQFGSLHNVPFGVIGTGMKCFLGKTVTIRKTQPYESFEAGAIFLEEDEHGYSWHISTIKSVVDYKGVDTAQLGFLVCKNYGGELEYYINEIMIDIHSLGSIEDARGAYLLFSVRDDVLMTSYNDKYTPFHELSEEDLKRIAGRALTIYKYGDVPAWEKTETYSIIQTDPNFKETVIGTCSSYHKAQKCISSLNSAATYLQGNNSFGFKKLGESEKESTENVGEMACVSKAQITGDKFNSMDSIYRRAWLGVAGVRDIDYSYRIDSPSSVSLEPTRLEETPLEWCNPVITEEGVLF